MMKASFKLILLFALSIFTVKSFAADPCVAYCVTISDRPALYTRATHEVLSAFQVTGASPQEIVDQCPDYPLGRTMLLAFYAPVRLRVGLNHLPSDYLKLSEVVVATEANACTAATNRPLKP